MTERGEEHWQKGGIWGEERVSRLERVQFRELPKASSEGEKIKEILSEDYLLVLLMVNVKNRCMIGSSCGTRHAANTARFRAMIEKASFCQSGNESHPLVNWKAKKKMSIFGKDECVLDHSN